MTGTGSDQEWSFETKQVHSGQEKPDLATGARAVPIYQTNSYVFPSSEVAAGRFGLSEGGNIYSRMTNPTCDVFEQRMTALEGGVGALAVASGATAVAYALMNIMRAGDHVIADKYIYGGSFNLFLNTFKDFGMSASFVDAFDVDKVVAAIQPNTKAIFVETLSNPNSTLVDIEALSEVAHTAGIPLLVDNTFATPYLLRPFEHGADVVVHSASKFIGGHGTSIGGVIVDGGTFDWGQNDKFPGLTEPNASYHDIVFNDSIEDGPYIAKARLTLLRDTGAALAPLNAFLFLQGLETLSLRVERHVENALAVVEFLRTRPEIKHVNHPSISSHRNHALYNKYFPQGGGSVFTIELNGTAQVAQGFAERLKLFSLLANVADAKSLVIHPASTTHSQMTESELLEAGITPTTVRLSIGIENSKDIIADLSQALNAL